MTFKVVADRKSHPIDKKDLLTLMLDGRDQKTGERISDESIVFNVSSSENYSLV